MTYVEGTGTLVAPTTVEVNGHTLTSIINKKEEGMLRAYVNNGGFIFAEACCNSEEFDREFREVIKKVTGWTVIEILLRLLGGG